MKVRLLRNFLENPHIMPGYRAQAGMKFLLHNNHWNWYHGANTNSINFDGMCVIAKYETILLIRDEKSKFEFKIDLREVKKSTIVMVEENHED
jgi:hypothetical protein